MPWTRASKPAGGMAAHTGRNRAATSAVRRANRTSGARWRSTAGVYAGVARAKSREDIIGSWGAWGSTLGNGERCPIYGRARLAATATRPRTLFVRTPGVVHKRTPPARATDRRSRDERRAGADRRTGADRRDDR